MTKIIYLISVLKNLKIAMMVIALITVVAVPFIIIGVAIRNDGVYPEDKIDLRAIVKPKLKLIIFLVAINIAGIIFIPNNETMYTMLITDKLLTEENYNMTVNEAKKLIEYTVKKIEQVKEKK